MLAADPRIAEHDGAGRAAADGHGLRAKGQVELLLRRPHADRGAGWAGHGREAFVWRTQRAKAESVLVVGGVVGLSLTVKLTRNRTKDWRLCKIAGPIPSRGTSMSNLFVASKTLPLLLRKVTLKLRPLRAAAAKPKEV